MTVEILSFARQSGNFCKVTWRVAGNVERVRVERMRLNPTGDPSKGARRWHDLILSQFGLHPLTFAEGATVRRDPATGVVDMPRHFGELRGRPPKGKRAMTDAERARAYRQRKAEGIA